ncbi:Fanconi anemia-associated protein of 100 kDa [Platysternon megacephalum]|uniref:Fanconi anemia-associated protein of 100 kDa n=1 Tax=Platysternon megacephalum TaxID=55544 RepID=A0A4D9EKM7_9SAUR|nr:Fanconi anemia-associated protein of 100 kDa [Platysternon megacephalum]
MVRFSPTIAVQLGEVPLSTSPWHISAAELAEASQREPQGLARSSSLSQESPLYSLQPSPASSPQWGIGKNIAAALSIRSYLCTMQTIAVTPLPSFPRCHVLAVAGCTDSYRTVGLILSYTQASLCHTGNIRGALRWVGMGLAP